MEEKHNNIRVSVVEDNHFIRMALLQYLQEIACQQQG